MTVAYTLKTKGTPGKYELPETVWDLESQANLLATAANEAWLAYFGDGSTPGIRDTLSDAGRETFDPKFRALHQNVQDMDIFMAGRHSKP